MAWFKSYKRNSDQILQAPLERKSNGFNFWFILRKEENLLMETNEKGYILYC